MLILYLLAIGTLCCNVDALAENSANVALNKPAYEQSVYANMVASNANDGNLQTSSCTTMDNVNPWWAVDLEQPHRVREVEIVNDNNAYFAYRLNNFLVKLTNVQPTPGQPLSSDNTLCAQYNGSVASLGAAKVSCQSNLQPFRYVVIQGSLSTADAICLTEVRVCGEANVASNKPAYEQSVYIAMVASNANDGNLQTSSCTTMNNVNPWWAVDLGKQHVVREVEIINAIGAYFAYRLNNFYVKLTNVQPTPGQPLSSDSTLCAQYNGSVASLGAAKVSCQSNLQPFRYVAIQGSLSKADAICLAEVRAFGDANLASNMPAYAQSVYANMVASNANDGNLQSSSCTTMGNVNPWWAVDLGRQQRVKEVEIVNDNNAYFAYRLNNFYVKLTNVQPTPGQPLSSDSTLCAQYNGSVANLGAAKVSCQSNLQPFRYVVIQGSLSTADAICLTEVRVYGFGCLVDPCSEATNLCSNGGKCISSPSTGSYTCQCSSTFTGKNCETAVDPCTAATTNPCLNGGKCVGTAGTSIYTCECPSTFTGKNCETGKDPCTTTKILPCLNGGKCIGVAGTSTFTCQCAKGFTGSKCENVDYCANNPCKNGGSCRSLNEGYACSCKTGFAGVDCSMDAAACSAVSSTSQINCGWGGVTAEDCNARSCCFNKKPPAGAAACFFQATDCANIPLSDRVDCRGTSSIMSKVICNGRGCCYDNSATNKGPFCYRQASKARCIGVSADRRISQGTGATMPNECEARGHCWDSSVTDNKLWCFSIKP